MALLISIGRNPWGSRLDKIRNSKQCRDGIFQNESETVVMGEKGAFFRVLKKFLFKTEEVKPSRSIPGVKTDLKVLPDGNPVMVWFGHSSYLIKIEGLHVLVDPVFSGYASPFKLGSAKSFEGSDIYSVEDLPPIDILLITHDHYDHCDYRTIVKLDHKVGHILTSLGVGSHLEYWGIDANKITELDWHEDYEQGGLKFLSAPARHFSGRGFTRAKTLWASFILKANNFSIYIGSDSGYDKHFKTIGDLHGPFDIAILESGQYYEEWKSIHMMPEEAVQASVDLKANVMMPVHWGKFALAFHPWNEPIDRVMKKAGELNVEVVTPMIGESVMIGESSRTKHWWKTI